MYKHLRGKLIRYRLYDRFIHVIAVPIPSNIIRAIVQPWPRDVVSNPRGMTSELLVKPRAGVGKMPPRAGNRK